MKMSGCPHCGGILQVLKKKCRQCGLLLEADFNENPIVLLARDEQDFLLDFIICGGNFKALGEKRGVTYPTLRSHLDRIIEKLKELGSLMSADDILDAIDKGTLKPDEALRHLKKIT